MVQRIRKRQMVIPIRRNVITCKVFSFGCFLFELLMLSSPKPGIELESQFSSSIVQATLRNGQLKAIVELSKLATKKDPKDRPPADHVLFRLSTL